jgi:epoxyqueuosine reductase
MVAVSSLQELSAGIKLKAVELGFDACGIAPPSGLPELERLPEWLSRGYAGEMAYLSRTAGQRADATGALPSARSVIVTATLYNTDRPFSMQCSDPSRAHVSRYAWGDDYHQLLMRRLDRLIAWMHEVHPATFEATPYVDTGPVQERVFARHAGIGWIGKNCCVINRDLGSFIFLSEIICSLPLEFDRPAFDQCGSCTLCLDVCPTGALLEPGLLDARRCISYLTIEQRGEIGDEFKADIGTLVYGCDVCQEVCPYNAAAPVSDDPAWQPRPLWQTPAVDELLHIGDAELRASLVNSAMQRAKVAGLRRNFKVAAENAPATRTVRG